MVGWSGTAPSCIRPCKGIIRMALNVNGYILKMILILAVNQTHFLLNGLQYFNNSHVKLQDIGVGNNALRCLTPSSDCCRYFRIGEFYYPNKQTVGINGDRESFYRNRRDGEILLNKRPQSTGPVGKYKCEIPDGCDEIVSIYITISK